MIDSFQSHRFIRFAEDGNTAECLALIARTKCSESSEPSFDINAKDDEGWTALHKAAQNGHEATVLKLVELGACVYAVDGAGVTPLHLASRSGHVPTMRVLLSLHADPGAKDDYGWSPIHQTANRGRTRAVMALLESGADLLVEDKMGMTALHLASKAGTLDLVVLLLARGAVVNAKNGARKTAFDVARIGSAQAKLALIAYGAEKNNETSADADLEALGFGENQGKGFSISMHQAAARGGFYDRIRFLLSECPSLDPRDAPEHLAFLARQGLHTETASVIESCVASQAIDKALATLLPGSQEKLNADLFIAAKTGNGEGCVKLIQAGADVNACDKESWTPLHWAAHYQHSSTVGVLIHGGANLNAVDSKNATPLHRAAGYGDTETVLLLVEAGAPVNAADARGLSPLNWAKNALGVSPGQGAPDERTLSVKLQIVLALIAHGANPAHGPGELRATIASEAAVLGQFIRRIKALSDGGICALKDLLVFARRHERSDAASFIEALMAAVHAARGCVPSGQATLTQFKRFTLFTPLSAKPWF